MAPFNWKGSLRFIGLKFAGAVLALIFLGLALIFTGVPLFSLVVSRGGDEAKIQAVSNHLGKAQTGFRVGGLFTASVKIDKKTCDQVYCLYPAWPDQLEPTPGDYIQVWPEKKPLIGAPYTEGWGWFILGTLFIFGLVFFEFAFLSLTLR
jgi:hypothetical protein